MSSGAERVSRKLFSIAASLAFFTSLLSAQSEVPKFEVGAQYSVRGLMGTSTLNNGANCAGCDVVASGVGGRFVYNPFRFLSLEGEWNIYPHASGSSASNLHGGTATEGLFGAKAGWRNHRFGLFAKVAPGYLAYSHAITSAVSSANGTFFNYGTVTHFTQYFGGVGEYYPVRQIALRVDVGQTLTRYSADFAGTTGTNWERNGQIDAGFSYRF
jgi:hypothetical protein